MGRFQWTTSFGVTQKEREETEVQMVVWEPYVCNSDIPISLVQSLSLTTNRDVWRCTVRCVQTHQDVVVTDGDCASQCEKEFKNCNVSSPPKFEAEACELSSSACG